MAISFLQGSKAFGHQIFPNKIPTVIQLQEWIEDAWDQGVNNYARSQVGTLKGTRKWIGTAEVSFHIFDMETMADFQACTLFEHFGIPFDGFNGYDEKPDEHARPSRMAHEVLLDKIEDYFCDDDEEEAKIHRTHKPPLYLQHYLHSLTVVGMEWRTDGSRNLLVFDPLFRTPEGMSRLLEKRLNPSTISDRLAYDVMRIYRRKAQYLAKYDGFETCL
jgi:zinc finger-containing ubiquitin peptidase 1